MDEIDRILASEPQIEPTPEFTRRMLEAVQREARTPPPLAFPWRRVAAAAVLLGIANTGFAAMPTQRVISTIDGTVAGVVLGSLAIVLWTLWAAWRAD